MTAPVWVPLKRQEHLTSNNFCDESPRGKLLLYAAGDGRLGYPRASFLYSSFLVDIMVRALLAGSLSSGFSSSISLERKRGKIGDEMKGQNRSTAQ